LYNQNIFLIFPQNILIMSDIEQIKVNLPKELKEKFVKKAKRMNKTQTSAIKTLITKFVNE